MGQGNLEQRILNSNMNRTDHRAEVSSIDNAGASIGTADYINTICYHRTHFRACFRERSCIVYSTFSTSNFVARLGRHGDTKTIRQGHTILNAGYLSSFTI